MSLKPNKLLTDQTLPFFLQIELKTTFWSNLNFRPSKDKTPPLNASSQLIDQSRKAGQASWDSLMMKKLEKLLVQENWITACLLFAVLPSFAILLKNR
jgi:hypothetical protein